MTSRILRIVVAAAIVGASLITETTFPKAAPPPAASLEISHPQHNQVLL